DDDLGRARIDVLARAFAVGEQPGRLQHDVDVEVAPRQAVRVALREHADLVPADGDGPVPNLNVLVEPPEHGVVPEQVSHRLQIPEIVSSDDLEVTAPVQVSAEKVPPNPPEPVDPNLRLGHLAP